MNKSEPTFRSKDEELEYWKNRAAEYQEIVARVQKELDDYIGDSQQLEREYEATIEQNDKRIKTLEHATNRAQNELEAARVKLQTAHKLNHQLQEELDNLARDKCQTSNYIRELEQKNDDLERARRIREESIAGIEAAFNNEIEKNAILESEVDEKEALKEKLQRLKDERRDLKQELHVQEGKPKNGLIVDSNRLREIETQTTPVTKSDAFGKGQMTPSTRAMALNLVSDLIRKAGNLERLVEHRVEYNKIAQKSIRNEVSKVTK